MICPGPSTPDQLLTSSGQRESLGSISGPYFLTWACPIHTCAAHSPSPGNLDPSRVISQRPEMTLFQGVWVIFSIEYLRWHLFPNRISQDTMDKSLNFPETQFPYLTNGRVSPAQRLFCGCFEDPEQKLSLSVIQSYFHVP